MHLQGPAVVEASAGDYRYVLERLKDGTFRCMQSLIDGSQTDELNDWSQLPAAIRAAFTKAAAN